MFQRANGIFEKKDILDDEIAKHLKAGWRTDRLSKVSLAILRLAVYEILFIDDIPDNVSVNEAVELAKAYDIDEAPSFINGVLSNILASKAYLKGEDAVGGKIYTATVSQLNRFIKQMMDGTPILNNIWVKGEISNYKQHYSGHCYLTLKDEGGVLKAVMFKSSALRLAFAPENGMKVLARGRVSVYERDGAYQLYIEEMQPDGVGSLHIAYEQLKAKLLEEGLFDEAHKKPLPQYPSTIGVVTATTGAAVRDIINVLIAVGIRARRC